MRKRTIAVASGKGGVGKTTTAVNLAVHFARKGKRVALADLDPLSDIATLLDISDPESALRAAGVRRSGDRQPGDVDTEIERLTAAPRLDLLFPAAAGADHSAEEILVALYDRHVTDLLEQYDLFIFDLAAGNAFDDNLVFVPFAGELLVVTNPEPTAHVAGGGYIRSVLDSLASLPAESARSVSLHVWHNRYTTARADEFNPKDILGNYNRNIPEEDRVEGIVVPDIAFIPYDPILDLLRSGIPNPRILVIRHLVDLLAAVREERARDSVEAIPGPAAIRRLIAVGAARADLSRDTAAVVDEVETYLRGVIPRTVGQSFAEDLEPEAVLRDEQLRALRDAVEGFRADPLVRSIDRVRHLVSGTAGERTNVAAGDRRLDRELVTILTALNDTPTGDGRRYGGLIAFHYAVLKLLQSRSILRLFVGLIPRRTVAGRNERDRRAQIAFLIGNDAEVRGRHVEFMRKVLPIVSKQLSVLVDTFKLNHLLYREPDGSTNRRAYVVLLSDIVQNVVFGGLGVLSGFRRRRASEEFSEAASRLERALADLSR